MWTEFSYPAKTRTKKSNKNNHTYYRIPDPLSPCTRGCSKVCRGERFRFTSKSKTAVSVNWNLLFAKNKNQKIKPHPTLQLMELSLEFIHPYNITLTPLVVSDNLSSTVHACEYMFNAITLLLEMSIKYTHTDVSPSLTKTWGKCTKMLKYRFFLRQTS